MAIGVFGVRSKYVFKSPVSNTLKVILPEAAPTCPVKTAVATVVPVLPGLAWKANLAPRTESFSSIVLLAASITDSSAVHFSFSCPINFCLACAACVTADLARSDVLVSSAFRFRMTAMRPLVEALCHSRISSLRGALW